MESTIFGAAVNGEGADCLPLCECGEPLYPYRDNAASPVEWVCVDCAVWQVGPDEPGDLEFEDAHTGLYPLDVLYTLADE